MTLRKRVVDFYGKGLQKTLLPSFREQKRLLAGTQVEVVFDVGAHVGSAAFAYRRLFPEAQITCFEPFVPSFEMLAANMAADARCECVNAAAAGTAERRRLFVNQSSATNSLLASNEALGQQMDIAATRNVGEVTVDVLTLDEFCAERDIRRVDILKLDAQGGELDALRGARGLLGKAAISLIYSEVEFARIYEAQPLFHDVAAYLEEFGFRFLNLFNTRVRDSQLLWGDAIFIGPGLAARGPGGAKA